jgi:hypothetical protein
MTESYIDSKTPCVIENFAQLLKYIETLFREKHGKDLLVGTPPKDPENKQWATFLTKTGNVVRQDWVRRLKARTPIKHEQAHKISTALGKVLKELDSETTIPATSPVVFA